MKSRNKNEYIRERLKDIVLWIMLILTVWFGIKNIASLALSAENMTGLPSTSWMALIGVVLGQIISFLIRGYEKHMDKKFEMRKSISMTQSIIANFLTKEINYNFKLFFTPMQGIKKRLKELHSGSEHKQYGFGGIQFEFKEYDKVKYEIIKYNNELTLEVLEIYNFFYFLMDKKDLNNMTIEEIEKVVNVYDKYIDKYLIKI